MPVVRYARGAVLLLCGIGLAPLPVAAQSAGERIDRTIVSPFAGDRRIVVRPGPDGGAEVVAVGARFDAPAPTVAPRSSAAPAPAAAFIDIGPLDAAPVAPRADPLPALQGDFIDLGPYFDAEVPFPASPSSFPPD